MATYAGPDQETTQVDDTMQLLLACGGIPISANQNFDNIFNIVTLKAPC